MHPKRFSTGEKVHLQKNALYPDGIDVPKRFLAHSFTVLSSSQKTVLLSGLMRHISPDFLARLEDGEDLWYTIFINP